MRILITNDDGIDAPGLSVLYDIAAQITDPSQIYTVAPAYEQSGVGHCITYTKPLSFTKRNDNSFAVDGSPADCVIVGLFEVLNGEKPDLILSGVNDGNNAAQNTLYSGTVGATIEAAMHGVPSIALSQFYGGALIGHDTFETARAHGAQTVQQIIDHNVWNDGQSKLFYNVNFPPVRASDVLGTKATAQGFRDGSPFKCAQTGDELRIMGTSQHEKTAKGTDVHANLEGYIAVTPCRIDLTVHDNIAKLQGAFK